MTTPIKRYIKKVTYLGHGRIDVTVAEDPAGELMFYEDHLAAVEAAVKAERDETLKELILRERKHGDSPYTQVTEGRMWGVKEAIELIAARSQPMSQPKEGV